MREGTGNFQNGDLLYMATHPVADAIRIGRTKPYECKYPVMESKQNANTTVRILSGRKENRLAVGTHPSTCRKKPHVSGLRLRM